MFGVTIKQQNNWHDKCVCYRMNIEKLFQWSFILMSLEKWTMLWIGENNRVEHGRENKGGKLSFWQEQMSVLAAYRTAWCPLQSWSSGSAVSLFTGLTSDIFSLL